MGFLGNIRQGESVMAIKLLDMGACFEVVQLYKKNGIIVDTMQGQSYPIASQPVKLRLKSKIKPGEYLAYLCHERGATVHPKIKPDEINDKPLDENQTTTRNIILEPGMSIGELRSDPYLTNRIITNNILGEAIALKPSRAQIIIALLAGIILGAIIGMYILTLIG